MSSGFRSPIRLALGETRVQLRLLVRNPVSVLFTVALPLLLLPLLDALQGDVFVQLPAAPSSVDRFAPWMQYSTPAIAAFSVVAACFANLAIRTAVARESGVLKRVRGTPLPPASHLAGRVLSNAIVALLVAVVTLAAGIALYDVEVAPESLPVVAALVVFGSAVFSALRLATTTIIPNSDAAPAVVYALLFPLAFLSNVFYPPELAPDWMERTAQALPLGPFVSAMVGALTPQATDSGVLFGELAAMLGWGVFGVCVSLVAFRWVPNRERTAGAGTRRSGVLRLLAIPFGVAAVVAGILVPDERPVEEYRLASVNGLEQGGVITRDIVIDPANISSSDGAALIPGTVDTGETPVTFAVSVIDRGSGPEAFGFQGCGIEPTATVDAEWLDSVAPSGPTGSYVQPCNGAVYESDLTCASGPCFGPLVLPTSVDGNRVVVRAEGALEIDAAPKPEPPAVPPGSYRGELVIGDDEAAVATNIELVADERGVALVDLAGGWEIRLVSSSPWLGTITGFDVLGPPDRSELLTSVFSNQPLSYASLPVEDERSIKEFGVRFTTSQPTPGLRLLTFGPADEDDAVGERGFVRLSTTGDLLRWDTIEMDFQVEGSPRIRLDLERIA